MCGISGFYNAKEDYSKDTVKWSYVLDSMRKCLSRRGNDEFGKYLTRHAGFSHARLCIRDLFHGSQPIVRSSFAGEYAIVYNGELYNTDELKTDLHSLGYTFSTTTDTEVILYAYMEYGAEFVQKLNGIFAFAIWDDVSQSLMLCRDRVGIKPLFYTYKNHQLIFASEPKALFAYPGFTPEITTESLLELLAIGPARTMGNGIFKDVKEVLPGHYLIFQEHSVTDHVYWDLTRSEHTDSYDQTKEKVSFLIRDAVKRQMVSDVPVCSFLSGGIDSSIVTALACQYLEPLGEKLNTFSFDFKNNDVYFQSNAFQPSRDLPYVNIMLKNCNTNHTFLECNENDLFLALFSDVDARDMPGMADVDSSLLYFCSLVKTHNKVALTGECADEIFGGYPWFYRKELMELDGFPWSSDIAFRATLLREDILTAKELSEYAKEHYLDSVRNAPHLADETPEEHRRYEIAYLNIKWFMQTLLDRMDRTSMYSGLEARVPFADHRIIEYVYNVPWEMKYQNGSEKALLRDACADLLPEEILHRKKSPYPKTYSPVYEKMLTEKMRSIVQNPNSPVLSILDTTKLETFLKTPAQYGKPWFGQLMAGPQLLAYYIQLNYWMEKYHLSL